MSKRMDLSEIRRLEEGLFANRPALESVTEGSWVWRFAKGYTGRANSLQSLDVDDAQNVEARLAHHWARSRGFGIRPRFRVTPLASPKIITLLEKQGFTRENNTLVMAVPLDGKFEMPNLRQGELGPEHKIIRTSVSDSQWRGAILELEEINAQDISTFLLLLDKLPQQAIGLGIYDENGAPVGAAYASHVENTGSVFALIVSPLYRGQGLGRHLMVYVLNWLNSAGVNRVTLQVVADNRPAMGLYSSLGFSEMYQYYYLVGE